MRRAAIRRAMLLAALVLTLQWPHAATQAQDVMYMLKLTIAIRGFDTVSYSTDGEAVKGRSEIVSEYGYQNWHFATEDHKRMFEADPARYLPQYGGLSAAELAAGGQQHANPANWVIVDGKLYMVSGGPGTSRLGSGRRTLGGTLGGDLRPAIFFARRPLRWTQPNTLVLHWIIEGRAGGCAFLWRG